MRRIIIILFFIVMSVSLSARESEDTITSILSYCSGSTACLITKSIVFFPVFPWFQYPYDQPGTRFQKKRFNRFSGMVDLMLSKENNSYSGYRGVIAIYKKWFGVDFDYTTVNNGEEDHKYFSTHAVIRFNQRKHLQPRLAIGWKYVNTNNNSGGGFEFSFFNYKITFNRRFHMYLINYIGWINEWAIVEGVLGLEYYVYPTISFKPMLEVKHVFSEMLYGLQFGLSIKI